MKHTRLLIMGSLLAIAAPLPALADPLLTVESDINRSGLDYSDFDLATANPDLCLAACAKSSQCRAYTYIKPGVQGPYAHCWLKQGVP